MGRTSPLRAFVERNLAELLEVPKVEPEPEGTYEFACGKTPIRVELNDESGMVLLHLLALLVQRPTKTNGRVLAFLNETNGMRIPIRVFRDEADVVAAWVVPVETMDDEQFQRVCSHFCQLADELASAAAESIGGRRPRRAPRRLDGEVVEA